MFPITVVLPSDSLVQALRRCGDEVFADVLLLELEQQDDFSGKVKVTARGVRDSGYGGRALSDVVRAVSNGRCFTDQLRAELGQVVELAGDGVLTFEIVLAPSQPPPLPLPPSPPPPLPWSPWPPPCLPCSFPSSPRLSPLGSALGAPGDCKRGGPA